MLRLTATPVKEKDLKPGDLFSYYNPEFWNNAGEHECNCGGKHPLEEGSN